MGSFRNRKEAGILLADHLKGYANEKSTLYALPRGGVPVAYEISVRLGIPLDVLVVKKIGAPGQEELALGAVTEGDPPLVYWNHEVIDSLGFSVTHMKPYLEAKKSELGEIVQIYRGAEGFNPDMSRTSIIVDDGIATGATVEAAIQYFRTRGAKKVVVAAPVSSWDVAKKLSREADDFISIVKPRFMSSVGEFYDDFRELDHAEAKKMLEDAQKLAKGKA